MSMWDPNAGIFTHAQKKPKCSQSQGDREKLEELCLSLVEEYLARKMTTTKGKRKGKVKTSYIEVSKKNKKTGKKENVAS